MTTLTVDLSEFDRDPRMLQAVGFMLLSLAGADLASKEAPPGNTAVIPPVPPAPIVPDFGNFHAKTDDPLPEGWQHVEGGSAVVAAIPPISGGPVISGAPVIGAVPTVPSTVPAGASDADGLQWDERIHSSSKALNADGTWRRRRNLDPAVLAAVEQELRGTSAPVVPPVPSAPAVPPPPPIPGVAVVPPVPPVAGVTYDGLMREVNQLIMTGKVQIIDVQTACSRHGLENLLELESRPDLLHAIANELAIGV